VRKIHIYSSGTRKKDKEKDTDKDIRQSDVYCGDRQTGALRMKEGKVRRRAGESWFPGIIS
jgi:hypothetical protein